MSNSKKNQPKKIWIDLLCFRSFFKVCISINKNKIDSVYFLNTSLTFSPFINFFSRILGVPIFQIKTIEFADNKIGNINLYELVQRRIRILMEDFSIRRKKFDIPSLNKELYNEHVKTLVAVYLHKPVELLVLSEKFNKEGENFFILKSTYIDNFIDKTAYKECKIDRFFLFTMLDSFIIKRRLYIHDNIVNSTYYKSSISTRLKEVFEWILGLIWLSFSLSTCKAPASNIAVDFFQNQVRKNKYNDLYWLSGSKIKAKNIFVFCHSDYDLESHKILDDLKVRRVMTFNVMFKLLLMKKMQLSSINKYEIVSPGWDYFLGTSSIVSKILFPSFQRKELKLLHEQKNIFLIKTMYWKSIYKKLNIDITWSMADSIGDGVMKAQALRERDGLYMGSHWSNFPLDQSTMAKYYDIFFPWSKHYTVNIFSHYQYRAIFGVGYPADYCFKFYKNTPKSTLSKDFVISFHDNVLRNDLPHTFSMWLKIYSMFVELTKEHHNLKIIFKPKRLNELNMIASKLDSFKGLLDKGVFKVSQGKFDAMPCEVSATSDLAIGMGISSAVAEVCFFGVTSFHADLAGFDNNFGKLGFGKIVFQDVKVLKNAIKKQINGNGITLSECRNLHRTLDSFQDGEAYKRTGNIIEQAHNLLSSGIGSEEVINNIRNRNAHLLL